MSRKKEVVVVPSDYPRDAGKAFLIEEAPAYQAQKWSMRFTIAVKGTTGFVPEDVARIGMPAVARSFLNAFLASDVKFSDLDPLMDELMACIRIIRDKRHPEVATALLPDDIEEVRTLYWIQGEVLRVHVGFSPAEVLSNWASALVATSPDSPST